MDYRKKLFSNFKLYDMDSWDKIFLETVIANLDYHIENNETYRNYLQSEGFSTSDLANIDDLYKIPVIPTLYFKSNTMYSMEREDLKWILNSSGTSGNSSEVGFDSKSIYYGLRAAYNAFRDKKLFSPIPTNYLILGYEPHGSNTMGAVKSAYNTTKLAPAISRTYALIFKDGKYEINIDGIIKSIEKYSTQPFPVRLVGFPGYIYMLVKELKSNGIKLKLNSRSKVIMGGGWKQFSNIEIDKDEFYQLIYEVLGIDKDNINEFFSAVEHPIAYTACINGNFHQPIHSKVIIRNPKTLEPVEYGNLGLLSFITPLVESMPLISIMTDDIAYMNDDCDCGIKSPYFKISNRVGIDGIKTCVEQSVEL